MCRSALFSSNTALACAASAALMCKSRSVISLCTVDFEIPNFFAVILTVALFSMMYSASLTVLSSMCSFKIIPPPKYCYLSVCTRRRKKYVLSRFYQAVKSFYFYAGRTTHTVPDFLMWRKQHQVGGSHSICMLLPCYGA